MLEKLNHLLHFPTWIFTLYYIDKIFRWFKMFHILKALIFPILKKKIWFDIILTYCQKIKKVKKKKAIEEKCEKYTWHGTFSRLAALGITFSKKQKQKPFLHAVFRSMCTKFQVSIVFRLVRRSRIDRDTHQTTNIYTSK